jgi:hypothetical protein
MILPLSLSRKMQAGDPMSVDPVEVSRKPLSRTCGAASRAFPIWRDTKMPPEKVQHRSPTVRKPAANTGRRAFANGELQGGQFRGAGRGLIIGCTPVFFKRAAVALHLARRQSSSRKRAQVRVPPGWGRRFATPSLTNRRFRRRVRIRPRSDHQ